jgi:hypothetical protein
MFRATMCSLYGGQLYEYNFWYNNYKLVGVRYTGRKKKKKKDRAEGVRCFPVCSSILPLAQQCGVVLSVVVSCRYLSSAVLSFLSAVVSCRYLSSAVLSCL